MSGARAKSALTGARKAAILLTVLGEEAAAVICRQLSSSDVQQLAAEVASLDAIPPELAQQVLEEYQQQATAQRFVIQGGADYATRLLKKAFGEENGKDLARKSTQTAARAAPASSTGCETPIRKQAGGASGKGTSADHRIDHGAPGTAARVTNSFEAAE